MPGSRPRAAFIIPVSLILFFHLPAAASESCYLSTPSGYQGMGGAGTLGPYSSSFRCEAVNNQYFDGYGTCSCSGGGGWGDSTGGDTGYDWEWYYRRQELERQRREEEGRRRKLRELKEGEDERDREAEERFIREKDETLNRLKDSGSGSLKLKSGADFFGIKGGADDEMKLKDEFEDERLLGVTLEWKQHYCGRWIAGYSFPAARRGHVGEVRFLGRQALMSFTGGPVELDCPRTEPPPESYGVEVIGPESDSVKLYRAVIGATEEQAERMKKAEDNIMEGYKKKLGAEKEIERQKEKVSELKEKIEKEETSGSEPTPEQEDGEEDPNKALAAALEALALAKQSDAEADDLIRESREEKEDAAEMLDHFERVFNEVKDDPVKASGYLKDFEKQGGT